MLSILYWGSLILTPYAFQYIDFYSLYKGLASVAIGQILTISYFVTFTKNTVKYNIVDKIYKHVTQPEGILLLGAYLIISWEYKLLPSTYYETRYGVIWKDVWLQLACQDFLQYVIHRIEHVSIIYKQTHGYHHIHVRPIMFDAFDGSFSDTIAMIIIPLIITSNVVHTNTYSYIMFGTMYSSMLTLIHSEYDHPWEFAFRKIGFGTSYEHQIHHKYFKYNYGHIFMYWDHIFGTYYENNN